MLTLLTTDTLWLPFALITLTALVTIVLFYGKLRRFISLDQPPDLLYFTAQDILDRQGTVAVVHTGLYIHTALTFDVLHNNFVIDAIIWFKFNPSLIALSTIEQFVFDKAQILSRSAPETKVLNHELLVEYTVRIKFSSNLDYHYFPLDDHTIYIVMTNTAVSPKEMVFTALSTGLIWHKNTYTPGWIIQDKEVKTGYIQLQLDQYDPRTALTHPRVVFALKCMGKGVRKTATVIGPIFLAFIVGYLSLTLDALAHESSMLILSTTAVTGLLAYRYVLEELSPEVEYFTLMEYVYNLFLGVSFIIFVVDLVLIIVPLTPATRAVMRNSTYISTCSIVIVAQYLFLYRMALISNTRSQEMQ